MENSQIFAAGVKLKFQIPLDEKCTDLKWSPDGECLALAMESGKCPLWTMDTDEMDWRDNGAFAGVRAVAWDAQGKRVAFGFVDGTIQIQYRDKPVSVTWRDHGKLISEDAENRIYRWGEPASVKYLRASNQVHSGISGLVWNPGYIIILSSE